MPSETNKLKHLLLTILPLLAIKTIQAENIQISEKNTLPTLSLYNTTNLNQSEPRSTPEKTLIDSDMKKTSSPPRDSYLDALNHSHQSKDSPIRVIKPKVAKLIRRTYDGPVYRPQTEYGPPKDVYGPPKETYGPPNSIGEAQNPPRITYGDPYSAPPSPQGNLGYQNPYGSLQSSYGAPKPIYGPPQVPQNIYGPPQNTYYPGATSQGHGSTGSYELPELPQLPALPSIDFSWPFALKLNAFTIAKILLKLVIFKMIVKFIAVICLLLFIPKLEIKKGDKEDESDDDSRGLMPHWPMQQLNQGIFSFILNSIESYEKYNGHFINNQSSCKSLNCFKGRLENFYGNWSDLFNQYVNEEMESEKNSSLTKNS